MWPFGGSRKREEQRSIVEWPWDTGGPAPFQTLGVDRALTLVPVFGAARLLADSIASLEPRLYTLGNDGVQRRQPTPSLFRNPSARGTLFDWLHRAVVSMALQGDAIGLITARDFYGFPTMVEWLDPQTVQTQDSSMAGPGSYSNPLWWWWGRPITAEEIVHIPWFCMPYRVRGLSPIGAFRLTANVGLGASEYAAAWFNNGGVPPGTFRNTAQTMSQADADVITARVTARMRDRKPLVYGNDWEYNPIQIKPHEAEFIETTRMTATQIAVIYGIPPEKIGGSTGSTLTYSTVEMNTLDFLTFSLRPWLVRLESALSNLFPRGTFVRFDTTELLRTDVKTRAETDKMDIESGVRTANEIRADRDLPPLPKPPPIIPIPQSPATAPAPDGAPPSMNGKTPAVVNSQKGA